MNNYLVTVEHENGQRSTQLVQSPISINEKRAEIAKDLTDEHGTKRYENITVVSVDKESLPQVHHSTGN